MVNMITLKKLRCKKSRDLKEKEKEESIRPQYYRQKIEPVTSIK